MARHVIREVAVTPALAPDLVVFRREDIQRFIEAAFRTNADLRAELDAERAKRAESAIIDGSDDWSGYKKRPVTVPAWTEPGFENDNNIAFFESLRDKGDRLIAGAEDSDDDDPLDPPPERWTYHRTVGRHPAGTRRFA